MAFDSEPYSKYEEHAEKIDSEKNEKFCVLWSYWSPSKWNEIKEVEYYFQVITKSEELSNRFLFYAQILIHNEDTYSFLTLGVLKGIDKAHDDLIRTTYFLNERYCKETSTERQTFVLRGNKQIRNSNGEIFAVFLVLRSEEPEIRDFIATRKIDSELKEGESKILSKFQCSKDKFEFLLEGPEPGSTKNMILV